MTLLHSPLRRVLRSPLRRPFVGRFGQSSGRPDLHIAQSKGVPFFLYDFARRDLTFQDAAGQTPADDPAEAVALALSIDQNGSKTLAEVVAAQPEKVKAGLVAADITASNVTVTDESAGVLRFTNVAGGVAIGTIPIPSGLTVGKLYRVSFDVFSPSANTIVNIGRINVNGTSFIAPTSEDVWQTRTMLVIYATGNISAQCSSLSQHGAAGDYFLARNISVKEIPGHHAVQTGAGNLRPIRQANGLLVPDGADDQLLTTLSPGVSITLLCKIVNVVSGTGTRVAIGGSTDTSSRCFMGRTGAGLVCGGVGDVSNNVIVGGSSITGLTGVMALSADGATVCLYWFPNTGGGGQIHTSAQSGTLGTTTALRLFSTNQGGVPNFYDTSPHRFDMAIQAALSAAEISQIANYWNATP